LTPSTIMQPDILRRIVNAKYVFEKARSIQSESNEMSMSISLLLMHDAIELLMLAVLDYRNVTPAKRREFMEFWQELTNAGLPSPPDYIPMDSLNKLRVGLKHSGNLPNTQVVMQLTPRVRGFFENVLKSHCDIDYEDVSLIDLIADQEVRGPLKNAQRNFVRGDKLAAMVELKVAFHKIENSAGKRIEKLRPPDRPSLPNDLDREVGSYMQQLHDFLDRCAIRTNLLTMGIDLDRYSEFSKAGPTLQWSASGKYSAFSRSTCEEITEEQFDGFVSFLIDYALLE
jgi:hypothetical protein